jgi:hypothetical protein
MSMPRSPLGRRPSAAMVVATTALFVALGGVGYAAYSVPANSVGRAQIRSGAVNYQKIQPGSVGVARINKSTVQARVLGACTTGNSAITSITSSGKATCAATRPAEFDTSNSTPQPLTSSSTTDAVASESLSGSSSYLVSANPYVAVTGTAGVDQHVTVTCELAVGGSTAVRNATYDLAADHETESGAIPLEATVRASSTPVTASVVCSRSITSATATAAAPTVTAVTAINALQTSSNTTEPDATVPYAIAPARRSG